MSRPYHGEVFNVSPAEILTIAVIALLVFGPRRLPDIARRAGKVLRDLRDAAGDLRSELESEYQDVVGPLSEASRDVTAAVSGAGDPSAGSEDTPEPEAADQLDEEEGR